ncbi:hypothetical protein UA08_01988 [Talaromyces atroroseus]|uniref:FAD-dependent oxidoreductase 2 FAD-binding domain-containing protein n=1 Tax=Talaromyces atroroseus TaxID=1441469 RepID=A0A1Q5QBZ9_TALAT|nr:hypothetical protein UA08_01988 [Talaromyces atroroseus]OKL63436.1 hypothetical protein UA08_01988 [Talaromyces atroroseus]
MAAPEPPLHLIIIGGGLCGLSAAIATRLAGNRVTVLESVPEFREVLKLPLQNISEMRRFNGEWLDERTQYAEEIEGRHGSPLWYQHRADLQVAMAEKAMELGVVIKLGCKVSGVNYGEQRPQTEEISVSIEGGEMRGISCLLPMASDQILG